MADACASTCYLPINIPGPAGAVGAAGVNGINGSNAWTALAAAFTMPAVGGTGIAEVGDTGWMIPSFDVGGAGQVNGQVIVVEFLGSFLATMIVDATHVELYNLAYPYSAPPGTIAPPASKVGVGGQIGP